VFNHFSKYLTKILLGDFEIKLQREDTFKLTAWNESLHKDSNDNSAEAAKSAT
jgi:hypothetical protein